MPGRIQLGPLLRQALGWVVAVPCPLCRAPLEGLPGEVRFCGHCLQRLELPPRGVGGTSPLPFPWWAAGVYAGPMRSLLLNLKRSPRPALIDALLTGLQPPPAGREVLLTPIPSWRRGGNALPGAIGERVARKLGLRQGNLLVHHHPVLSQHRLGRELRQENQRGALLSRNRPDGRRREVILVDDILTSGATLRSAADALLAAGWRIRGAVCLARTVRPGRSSPGQ